SATLGDDRSLERDVRDRQRVAETLGELERELDVLARRLEVALTARAPRAPLEDVRAKAIARKTRARREVVGLGEKADRRVDRRELVADDAHPIEHVRPLDVGEDLQLGELARTRERIERLALLAEVRTRPAVREQRAELELGRVGAEAKPAERLARLL